jgi:DNA-binding transcriptional LysR family regulator
MKDDLLDIALTLKPVNNDIFAYIPVTSINFWVVVNKKNTLANVNKIRFEELKSQKFILLSNEYKSSDTIINCCINKGFEPNIIFTSAQQELIIEMVALNKGITILPENSSHRASKSNENVTALSLIDSPLKTEMGFIVKKSRKQDSILNVLIEFIVKYFDCINL